MKTFLVLIFFSIHFGQALFAQRPEIEIHGHRGIRGRYPENTVEGFIRAWQSGAQWLELDIVISADSQLVVSHDPYFNPKICDCTDGKAANFYRMNYDSIRRVDCGKKGHPDFPDQEKAPAVKPLLGEVFNELDAHFPNKQARYNIEIKSKPKEYGIKQPSPERIAFLVYREMKRYGMLERSLVQSFDPAVLNAFYKLNPNQRLGLLTFTFRPLLRQLARLTFKPYTYNPYYRLFSRRTVKKAHLLGVKVIPWTANKPKDIKRCLKKGVDGVISDFPDRVKEAVEKPN